MQQHSHNQPQFNSLSRCILHTHKIALTFFHLPYIVLLKKWYLCGGFIKIMSNQIITLKAYLNVITQTRQFSSAQCRFRLG
jgi:hypothetical protein